MHRMLLCANERDLLKLRMVSDSRVRQLTLDKHKIVALSSMGTAAMRFITLWALLNPLFRFLSASISPIIEHHRKLLTFAGGARVEPLTA